MTVLNLIDEYIKTKPLKEPIYSNEIQKYVLTKAKINDATINEYINRYEEKNNDFIRYRKGIYYKTVKTPFGYSPINYQKLINDLYIINNNKKIGYISGPSFANRIGLTTEISKYEYITTNNNRVVSGIDNLKLIKPVIKVNDDNYKYLQVLDLLANKNNIYFNCDNPNRIIYEYIIKNNIDFKGLLKYSIYFGKKCLLKLQEVCFNNDEIAS